MTKTVPYGFTLVEVVLVMAISSLMVVFVFAGQAGLRSQANFDTDIDKMVAAVDYARNQATAGTNLVGAGDGTTNCAGVGSGQTYFAGTVLEVNNSLPGSIMQLKYYKANPGNGGAGMAACYFQKQTISLPSSDISLSATSPSTQALVFARTSTADLVVCAVSNAADTSTQVVQTFELGACSGGATALGAAGTVKLTLKDAENHKSDIQVDASGLAKRLD